MPRMHTDASFSGFMRCFCGTRFRVEEGRGECIACGATATAVLATRWRTCALDGCEREFLPSSVDQRTCCQEHSRLYFNQRQRERRAVRQGKGRAERMRVILREPHCVQGPRSAPMPTHICAGYPGHKCTVRTADRRCPKCRAMWKAMHGVSGNYDPSVSLVSAIDACPFL